MAGVLFVVGTPIGNLGDASPRARETLGSVDVVAAEDTRWTGRLLQGFGVKAKLVSLFDGNERERTPELLARLREGETVALVSDGGMPLVTDPGYRLVAACVEDGIEVQVVPGPSALVRGARRERAADGAFRVRGLPAQEGGRPDAAAGGAPRDPAPSSSTSRRSASRRYCATCSSPSATGASPCAAS